MRINYFHSLELVILNRQYLAIITILFIFTASSLLLFSCKSEDDALENRVNNGEETGDELPGETDELLNEAQEEKDEVDNDKVGNEEVDNEEVDNEEVDNEEVDNEDQSFNQVTEPELTRLPGDFYIGVYSGQGSWHESAEATRRFLDKHEINWDDFDEEDALRSEVLNRFDLLWFPGGFAAEYKNYIKDHSIIRDFVHEGGLFVGSCAGAYYASAILQWEGTAYEYPLNFFAGKGSGPIPAIAYGEATTIDLKDGHPVNQNFDPSTEMYYLDGPYFEFNSDEQIEILARYRVNEEPAVIAGKSEDGAYLLLGPHPELGGYSETSQNYNLDGEEGARWPWLYDLIKWFGGAYNK